ncbi:hypothetical protein A0H81_11504 [Grifola frondosa]|uniref:Uncharacterized protein n=1 Tax=Grifola frondosa TaxID=5627 RepID=A0A1C7LU91_GRIFR|nr:hypothetical protein A0H81_11504 [Grifola frondosa]
MTQTRCVHAQIRNQWSLEATRQSLHRTSIAQYSNDIYKKKGSEAPLYALPVSENAMDEMGKERDALIPHCRNPAPCLHLWNGKAPKEQLLSLQG